MDLVFGSTWFNLSSRTGASCSDQLTRTTHSSPMGCSHCVHSLWMDATGAGSYSFTGQEGAIGRGRVAVGKSLCVYLKFISNSLSF